MARASKLIGFLICAQMLVWGAHSNITLGTNALVFGPDSGTGSVVVDASHHWKAITDSDWIHIDRESERSDAGGPSALLKFTYDANPGPTRTGSIELKHGGQGRATLSITQAGADYIATSEVTTLLSRELSSPVFDASGNIYFTDYVAGTVKKWTAATGQVTVLVSLGLKHPSSVAVANSGDVYIADTGHNAIKKWSAATGQLTGLVFGLNQPTGVALDGALNLYIADYGNNAVEKWAPDSGQLTTIASSLNQPTSVAVDAYGNVYIADTGNQIIEKWAADTGQVSTLISGLRGPSSLTLDGAGNLYFNDNGNIVKWTAVNAQLTIVSRSTFGFDIQGVGSDSAGNLSVSWSSLHHGFTGSAISAPNASPNEFSIYTCLSGTSDLAVDTLGNVYFNDVSVLGFSSIRKWLASTGELADLEPNAYGSYPGLATDNAGDLYFTIKNASWPFGSIHIGPTGQTVDDSFGEFPAGLAVDPLGDVYFADTAYTLYNPPYPPSTNDAIKKWTASTGQVTALVPGLTNPDKVALDAAGNVYFSLAYSSPTIQEWSASTGNVSTLVSRADTPQGNDPDTGVAVDGAGDVYFSSGGAIEKRAAATGAISILATPIIGPNRAFSWDGVLGAAAIKLDNLNNIYAISYGEIKKLTRAFVGPAAVVEPLSSGSDQLLPVLPSGTPLDAVSDEPWLTITSQDNGVVQFGFTATTTPRTAHITVLGQTIPVMQTDSSYAQ